MNTAKDIARSLNRLVKRHGNVEIVEIVANWNHGSDKGNIIRFKKESKDD